jgi:hypothetical protein
MSILLPMKFLCHFKIIDKDLARITFAVVEDGHGTFVVTPIQTFLPGDAKYLSALTVDKEGEKWNYSFEIESGRMSDFLFGQVVAQLEKRLETVAG